MIAFVKGKILKRERERIFISLGAIGFEVFVPTYTKDDALKEGSEVFLWIKIYIGEKDVRIYGFTSEEELIVFDRITEIPKVGPQMALSIISHLGVEGVIKAVKDEDIVLLSEVPKVGEKSARRIISELKDTLLLAFDDKMKTVIEALYSLGYSKEEVRSVIGRLKVNKDLSEEDIVKEALRLLSGDRR